MHQQHFTRPNLAAIDQTVISGVKSYNDLAGNGVLIPHHTPELYTVEAFDVRVTATVLAGGMIDTDAASTGGLGREVVPLVAQALARAGERGA